MIHLDIKVCAVGDPPAFPECQPCQVGRLVGVAILQAGLQSGKTSVALMIKNEDGSFTAAETSAALFGAAAGAVAGAQERFGDPT